MNEARAKNAERNRRSRARQSDEKREEERAKNAERNRRSRARRTDEQREEERKRRRKDWANRDPEVRGAYNTKRKKRREKWALGDGRRGGGLI
jgi:hypothetical protein